MVVNCTQPIILDFLSSVRSEEAGISAASYNYNHYNLPFSHIIIIVIISDEDMLKKELPPVLMRPLDGL